jgi:hypothetical protein
MSPDERDVMEEEIKQEQLSEQKKDMPTTKRQPRTNIATFKSKMESIPESRLGTQGKEVNELVDDIEFFLKEFPSQLKSEKTIFNKVDKNNKNDLIKLHTKIATKLKPNISSSSSSSNKKVGIVINAESYIKEQMKKLLEEGVFSNLKPADIVVDAAGTKKAKINGIIPSAGGGSGVPPVGDIDFIGNLNCNDVLGGEAKGIITAEKKLVAGLGGIETSGNIEITSNGNLTLNGNGSILQLGSGSITSGSGGIESTGDIKTIGAFDLEIGKDIYFDGTDIYHRTFNPVAQQNYKDFKQLAGLNDANKFTGANQFNSNTTEFAAKVSVGTRDPVSLLFTQNLALNTSGNIESKTINNGTIIQCGTINCGNAGENEVRARVFNTRTNEHSSPDGWVIEQHYPIFQHNQ